MKTNRTFASKFGGVALIALALLAQLMTAVVAHAASVTLHWSFNYSVDPVCTTTVTKNCVTGFEYGTTPDGGNTLVKIGIAANPATTAPAAPPASACNSRKALRTARWSSTHAPGPRSQRQRGLFRRAVAPSAQLTPGVANQSGDHGKVGYFLQRFWMRRIESRANHCTVMVTVCVLRPNSFVAFSV